MTPAIATAPGQDLLHVARAYGLCGRLLSREGSRRPRQVARLLLRELSVLGWERAQRAIENFMATLPRRTRRYASWLATNVVPAYETSYREGAHASGGQTFTMADVAGFYRAYGFRVRDERPDYLGAQLEFLAVLSLKEAYALLAGNKEAADMCRATRGQFAHRHLHPWLPAFRQQAQAAAIHCLAWLAEAVDAMLDADLVRGGDESR
jgi:TorA maturation chaperone TorD